MSGEQKFFIGERVTISDVRGDAYDWMIGHPATIDTTAWDLGNRRGEQNYKLSFDRNYPNTHPHYDETHPAAYGWWVNDEIIIPYRTVKTTHDVW